MKLFIFFMVKNKNVACLHSIPGNIPPTAASTSLHACLLSCLSDNACLCSTSIQLLRMPRLHRILADFCSSSGCLISRSAGLQGRVQAHPSHAPLPSQSKLLKRASSSASSVSRSSNWEERLDETMGLGWRRVWVWVSRNAIEVEVAASQRTS